MVWSSSDASTSTFQLVPQEVRGMMSLDREKFKQQVTLPVIKIDAKDCTPIRSKVQLEKFLIKNLVNIKNVMEDPENKSKRLLVFDPSTMTEEQKGDISHQISTVTGNEAVFTEHQINISYDNIDLRRAIKAILPDGLEFSSFTQSGHLVHCNFRDDLLPYRNVIAEILLDKVKKCRTVVNKLDCIKSEYRNFELELLAGESDYIVELLEDGLTYKLDFSKVFWNTRLGFEHKRVSKLLNSRSLVYDACAGVGPFALPAAKTRCCRKVFANDLNPDSVHWLKENMKINKIKEGSVNVFNQDAADFIRGPVANDILGEISQCEDPEWTPPSGAHILMNLPAYAVNFLPAFKGMLHGRLNKEKLPFPITAYCYLFVKASEAQPHSWFENRAKEMVLEKIQWKDAEISTIHHVRTVSNFKEMFCIQIDLPLELLISEVDPPSMINDEGDEPLEKRQRKEEN